MKQTKCKICRVFYTKWSISQRTCEKPECAIELMEREKEKKARKRHQAEKIRLKSRREWAKDAQTAVNAYVRKRDEHLPCISCGRHHTGQYHAGHYLSVGARPELRFEECQINKQCAPCNNHLSGNIALYRINLIKKIGLDRVEWIEGPHPAAKYTIEELKGIISDYKQKIKDL